MLAITTKCENESSPHILVTSHGGFLRQLFIFLVKEHRCQMPSEDVDKYFMNNTSVTKVHFDLNKESLEATDFTCSVLYCDQHLKDN